MKTFAKAVGNLAPRLVLTKAARSAGALSRSNVERLQELPTEEGSNVSVVLQSDTNGQWNDASIVSRYS
jgi:hypothetical protein